MFILSAIQLTKAYDLAGQFIELVLFFDPRDLKRDISRKLEKLERRTQRAIVELIRELDD